MSLPQTPRPSTNFQARMSLHNVSQLDDSPAASATHTRAAAAAVPRSKRPRPTRLDALSPCAAAEQARARVAQSKRRRASDFVPREARVTQQDRHVDDAESDLYALNPAPPASVLTRALLAWTDQHGWDYWRADDFPAFARRVQDYAPGDSATEQVYFVRPPRGAAFELLPQRGDELRLVSQHNATCNARVADSQTDLGPLASARRTRVIVLDAVN